MKKCEFCGGKGEHHIQCPNYERALIDTLRADNERLRAWQKDAIDRIKVYINICDHQRVTGEYMGADTCVYCALDRALIDAAFRGEASAVQQSDALDAARYRWLIQRHCDDLSRCVPTLRAYRMMTTAEQIEQAIRELRGEAPAVQPSADPREPDFYRLRDKLSGEQIDFKTSQWTLCIGGTAFKPSDGVEP